MKKLSREEMKAVMGGGTCQALIPTISGGLTIVTGMSSSEASGAAGMVHWCCDNCGTATWALPY